MNQDWRVSRRRCRRKSVVLQPNQTCAYRQIDRAGGIIVRAESSSKSVLADSLPTYHDIRGIDHEPSPLAAKHPQKTLRPAVEPSDDANEEYSREFGEFVESISVTAEELAAIVSMPELSIPEIKQHLRDGKNGSPTTNQTPSGRAVPQVVKIRLPGRDRSKHRP